MVDEGGGGEGRETQREPGKQNIRRRRAAPQTGGGGGGGGGKKIDAHYDNQIIRDITTSLR